MMKGNIGRVESAPNPIREVATNTNLLDSGQCSRTILTGTNDIQIAALGTGLLERGRQVILSPAELSISSEDRLPLNASRAVSINGTTSIRDATNSKSNRLNEVEWDLVCYTSGSTGTPRPIGLKYDQLETTARWYADVYGLTQRSAIVSPLPSTYNFSFIAGAFTAAHSGCTYYTVNDVSQMMEFLTSPPDDHDQVVGLVNPVILETVADLKPEFDGRVLLDTGGAPMSRHAVKWYRTNVCDLREGYGLTETCSLTHFDRTGSEETAGTVGRSLPDVETEIRKIDGKPAILLHSPNIGVELNQDGSLKSEWPSYINTGDIGSHDSDGRLRILGRDSDISINGYWPKDTLDSIGPFLGARCAIVRHLPDKTVIVRIWSNLSPDRIREVCARIGDKLSVEISNVRVTTTGGDLLHSQKIPYKENNS